MAKFKVKFKIQALELEIEGDRDAIPGITQALQQQMGGMLAAPSAISDPEPQLRDVSPPQVANPSTKPARKRNRGSKPSASTVVDGGDQALNFQHDPDNWGSPNQSWSTAQKSIWLLFVAEAQGAAKEMSTGTIIATFNKHFRQAGQIKTGNLNRDFGTAKTKAPPLVGEDTTKTPSMWFLTDAGKAMARKLLEELKGSVNK